MSIKSIAVFCGSKTGNNVLFEEHTKQLGSLLAEKNVAIIYGGGNKGLMGAVANASLEKNGKVIGIMPQVLREWEHHHEGITELLIVDTMHTRKKMLYEKCDAAIILPGGYGTLDEVFEMLTWNQLKLHDKKLFILNTGGFYDHLLAHINMMHDTGFLYDNPLQKMSVLLHPHELTEYL
ncbi:MAG: TIGR00730 family Rossman fold protein [Ferruginibacter sp.]